MLRMRCSRSLKFGLKMIVGMTRSSRKTWRTLKGGSARMRAAIANASGMMRRIGNGETAMPELPEELYSGLDPAEVPFERLYVYGRYTALCGLAVELHRRYPHMHEMHAMIRERVDDAYALLKYLQDRDPDFEAKP